MSISNKNNNSLKGGAQFSLFITSYAPLFGLIILKQIHSNYTFLSWGGFSFETAICFVEKFGLSVILLLISVCGLYGAYKTLKRVDKLTMNNGIPYCITDIKNKNSEAINYIATYIIPFAFQQFSSWFDSVVVLIVILIIYRIYINSSLILVNPLLNIKYGLYDIEFKEKESIRKGLIVCKDKFLTEDENVKLYQIGHKMYYAINKNSVT